MKFKDLKVLLFYKKMYKRTNNYQSGSKDNDKADKLLKKYRVRYNTLAKSISQDKEGMTVFEDDNNNKYLYCNLTNDWYLKDNDERRQVLLKERESRLEKDINTMYMIKPTTELPDVRKPNDRRD